MFFSKPQQYAPFPPPNVATRMFDRREAILRAALKGGMSYEDAAKAAEAEYPKAEIAKAFEKHEKDMAAYRAKWG